jgi:hypothetical protein
MNTGLHDVWNLAWKLDLYLRGFGNERLLDSYTAERRPVIRQVIETTDFLTKAMGTPNKLAQFLRDAVIPMVSHLAPVQHAFVQRLSELGIAYGGSPIVEGAGERYFDDSLRKGDGICRRYLLALPESVGPSIKEMANRFGSSLGHLVELRSGAGSAITLVRPDGYVAYSTHSHDAAAILKSLRSVLGSQTSMDQTVAPPR